jgi:NNP family nitrate/nitrite transporter-like MFS transporter
VLGWISAIAAYGAFIIHTVFRSVIESNGAPDLGLYMFAAFYAFSMVVLWYFYLRKKTRARCIMACFGLCLQRYATTNVGSYVP